jgi:hypothetical protein
MAAEDGNKGAEGTAIDERKGGDGTARESKTALGGMEGK